MTKSNPMTSDIASEPAQVVREHGPFHEGETIHGVSHDGARVWFATGKKLRAFDPARDALTAELDLVCDAGTAFDGTHFYQLGNGSIQKVDPKSGHVLTQIKVPGEDKPAGLTWAEGKLWVTQYEARKIYQLDPHTGEVLRIIESNRFVTGITWADDELWHGTLEDGVSELRQIRPENGEVLTRLSMPAGSVVTGLEWDGADLLYCGGGKSGKVRAVKRPKKA